MRSTSKSTVAVLVCGTVALGVLGLSPTASARPPFQDDGTGITCVITGYVGFNPPLTDGAAGTSAVTFHDRLHDCLGAVTQEGWTITGGAETIDGTEVISSDCLSLAKSPATVPAFVMKTRYRPPSGSPVPNSYTTWATGTARLTLSSPLIISYTKATAVSGSFSSGTGPPPSLTEVIDQKPNTLVTECTSASGIARLNFTGANGLSRVTLG